MKLTTNKTVLDLNKVQHATFYWKDQFGRIYTLKPKAPSVNGEHISIDTVAHYHYQYPGETMLERAIRLGILDKITPCVRFQLTANHSITYTGEKAIERWGHWMVKMKGK